ncbi:hypothetical protein M23134_05490 [Microscilla marina ATCC 23134]|uniref:Uncharacterized protein n=1 Tax=Microscilla marina ATCC 23134 TaxID=313606 RepID=A1ZI00_MICM2|nr:hypothetical protein M23134_05490 [Microscilla marina ATCC 23134]
MICQSLVSNFYRKKQQKVLLYRQKAFLLQLIDEFCCNHTTTKFERLQLNSPLSYFVCYNSVIFPTNLTPIFLGTLPKTKILAPVLKKTIRHFQ